MAALPVSALVSAVNGGSSNIGLNEGPAATDHVGHAMACQSGSQQEHLPTWTQAPPSTPTIHATAESNAELLIQRLPATSAGAFERIYLYANGGIHAYRPGRVEMHWDEPAACARMPHLLLADERLAIFSTGFELFALDVASGARAWSSGAEPNNVDAVLSDPEDFPRYRYFAADHQRIVAARIDGHAICHDIQTGALLWTHQLGQIPNGPLTLSSDWLVYPTTATKQAAVCVVNPANGERLHLLPSPDGLPILHTLITHDGHILLVTAGALIAYQATDGARAWTYRVRERLTANSVTATPQAIYVSPDGYALTRIAMCSGAPLWQTASSRLARAEHFMLAAVNDRVILATEDDVTIFDAAAGRRIQRLRLGTSARDTDASETDARVDRWELLHDRLAGVSRRAGTDPTTIAVYLLDPQQTTTAAAPPDRYTMPNGRADNIWFANDALVLGGAGAVVSFAAPVPRIGARP